MNAVKSSNAQPTPISCKLEENRERMEQILGDCHDLSILPWQYGPDMSRSAVSFYFDTIVMNKQVNYMKSVLQDMVIHEVGPGTEVTTESIIHFFEQKGVNAQSAELVNNLDAAVNRVLDGYVVILYDGWNKALCFPATGVETRQISEPVNEAVVQGPRESTVENLQKNIALLRIRLKSSKLKLVMLEGGGETRTTIAYLYLKGVIKEELLAEFKNRIGRVKELDIMETSYIEELIQDSLYSPFPQYRITERPDVAVASLLDGKIVVLSQGSGSMLICPGLFVEMLQASEDYYQRTLGATMIRWVRIVAFFMALTLPSIYIALTTFHPEMIPTVLLLAILDAREGIPFPAFVEALIMEFFFELLREAGIRLPRPVGSAVSIVGALVIGEAAINAGIASPIMVVMVALTGIASFSIPQYNMAIALRIMRFPMMVMASFMGGFGILIGLLVILWHMMTLRTLGQQYISTLQWSGPQQLLNVFIRAPIQYLNRASMRKQGAGQAPKSNE